MAYLGHSPISNHGNISILTSRLENHCVVTFEPDCESKSGCWTFYVRKKTTSMCTLMNILICLGFFVAWYHHARVHHFLVDEHNIFIKCLAITSSPYAITTPISCVCNITTKITSICDSCDSLITACPGSHLMSNANKGRNQTSVK